MHITRITQPLPGCTNAQTQGDLHPLSVTSQLLVELLDAEGRTIAQHAFSERRPVYRWPAPLAVGRAARLRVSLRTPGADRFKLLLAEARVYGRLPRGAQCHARVCGAHGKCKQAHGGALSRPPLALPRPASTKHELAFFKQAGRARAAPPTASRPSPSGLPECVCQADWFGPNCDYDILTSSVYLPWPEADGAASWGPPAQWEAALDLAQGDDGNCTLALERAHAHELLPGPRGAGAGLASSLLYMLGDHTTALLAGAPYAFTGKINYAENGYCDVRGIPPGYTPSFALSQSPLLRRASRLRLFRPPSAHSAASRRIKSHMRRSSCSRARWSATSSRCSPGSAPWRSTGSSSGRSATRRRTLRAPRTASSGPSAST